MLRTGRCQHKQAAASEGAPTPTPDAGAGVGGWPHPPPSLHLPPPSDSSCIWVTGCSPGRLPDVCPVVSPVPCWLRTGRTGPQLHLQSLRQMNRERMTSLPLATPVAQAECTHRPHPMSHQTDTPSLPSPDADPNCFAFIFSCLEHALGNDVTFLK